LILLPPHPDNRVQLAVDIGDRNETVLIIAPWCDVDRRTTVEICSASRKSRLRSR